MATINITNARKNLYALVEQVQETHEPLVITGKNGSAVLLSEEDYNAIEETLYLTSIPGMKESLLKGKKEDPKKLSKKLEW